MRKEVKEQNRENTERERERERKSGGRKVVET